MASVTKQKNGSVRVEFTTSDGKRHPIRLGKIPMQQARDIGKHIDHLVRVKQTGEEPKRSTRDWVASTLPNFPIPGWVTDILLIQKPLARRKKRRRNYRNRVEWNRNTTQSTSCRKVAQNL